MELEDEQRTAFRPQTLLSRGVGTCKCCGDSIIFTLLLLCCVKIGKFFSDDCIAAGGRVKAGCNAEVWFSISLLWLLPTILFFGWVVRRYRFSASARQTVYVIIEAIVYIQPLLFVMNRFMTLDMTTPLREILNGQGRGLHSFGEFVERTLAHMVVAGIPEETLKYLCIRRILFSSRAADPSAVVTYGFGAGFGFSIGENIVYMWRRYVEYAEWDEQIAMGLVYREASTRWIVIPMHCICGIVTAANLGSAKFLGTYRNWVFVVFEAVMIHSMFNGLAGHQVQLLCTIGGVFYARWKLLPMANVTLVDFHACVRDGLIAPPSFLFWDVLKACYFAARYRDLRQLTSFFSSPAGQRRSFAGRLAGAEEELGSPWAPAQAVTKDDVCSCGNKIKRHKLLPCFCPICFSELRDLRETAQATFPNEFNYV